MIDLGARGFPVEVPLALSPVGIVATQFSWYRVDDPGSVTPMPAAPPGFAIGSGPTAINDAGDQARFLVSTGTQRPLFLFRFNHEGSWQQISFTGIIHTPFGVGSITDERDISATVVGVGMIAAGPDGLAHPLVDLLSPAYRDRVITVGGPINEAG
jgi:hypothetical protein